MSRLVFVLLVRGPFHDHYNSYCSEGYDNEVEAALETFMAVLEPILILIMAAAVSFVVAGVLLPIFEMNTMRGF